MKNIFTILFVSLLLTSCYEPISENGVVAYKSCTETNICECQIKFQEEKYGGNEILLIRCDDSIKVGQKYMIKPI